MFKKIFVSSLLSFSLLFAPGITQAALPTPVKQKFIPSPSDLCNCDTSIEFLYYKDLIYDPLRNLVNSLKEANNNYTKLRKQISDIACRTKLIQYDTIMKRIIFCVKNFGSKAVTANLPDLLAYMDFINKRIINLQSELDSLKSMA